jgi:hypothetical protein
MEIIDNCHANMNEINDKSIEDINTENIIICYQYFKNLFTLKKD